MGKIRPLVGLVATLGLSGFDKEGHADEPSASPLLHDVSSPTGLFEAIRRDPDLQLALGQQVMAALQETFTKGVHNKEAGRYEFTLPLPRSEGSFIANAVVGHPLVVSAHTSVGADSPYVYANNVTITLPECDKPGRSHLTMNYRTKEGGTYVSQSLVVYGDDVSRSEGKVSLNKETLTVSGIDHSGQMSRYNHSVNVLSCTIKEKLLKSMDEAL